jgi:uncharacterized protein YjdB|tara:strand:+ start:461 stop:838 length:378 start_codon:yes stop_codon:yes gene_type:complete
MKSIILSIVIMSLLTSCRSNAELSMERGEYFYNVNRLEEATLEYNKVINHYADDNDLESKNIKILANAHHNLAVIWFKRGYQSEDSIEKMSYLGIANIEAKRSYYLHPKDLYKQTWDKIQKAIKQ